MAYVEALFPSEALGFQARIGAIIPHSAEKKAKAKILYLLHGLSDDCSSWMRYTRVEVFANARNYAVIMPEVQRSFYMDMKYGSQYFTYITEELPKMCETLFGLEHSREKTFVAGLSMGGYGALKCGLTKPEFYAACASFAGVTDAEARLEYIKKQGIFREYHAILGENGILPESADLFKLAEEAASLPENKKPRVFVTCGLSDFILEENRKFNAHMSELPLEYMYKEWEGAHNWDFFGDSLPPAMDFFERKV